jgi:DNA-binding XRE family transcriptional regulator
MPAAVIAEEVALRTRQVDSTGRRHMNVYRRRRSEHSMRLTWPSVKSYSKIGKPHCRKQSHSVPASPIFKHGSWHYLDGAGQRKTKTDNRPYEAIGKRLRITREALRQTQAAFCKAAQVSPSAYNQMEKGGTRPSIDAAIGLCDAHGLSLDWIYLGDKAGLRHGLVRAIEALESVT